MPLNESVRHCMERYFAALDGHAPQGLYETVMAQVEPPLLRATLHYCAGNQSRAASILGINRTTLRKKLQAYKLSPHEPA